MSVMTCQPWGPGGLSFRRAYWATCLGLSLLPQPKPNTTQGYQRFSRSRSPAFPSLSYYPSLKPRPPSQVSDKPITLFTWGHTHPNAPAWLGYYYIQMLPKSVITRRLTWTNSLFVFFFVILSYIFCNDNRALYLKQIIPCPPVRT